ncbi:Hpt domain-containing protein [Vibrio sp. ZSDE26]|uniref:Hpt domain-containing protein n=1 Tax=Vibrio amylolyticus TaxID=2847292 RepID=A0A9X1XMN5_9VIBR|nr:Hpt domain-containing protein [Vibrio amylolyticus]MCK6264678.1 Hpt domain-containing protein [Vibrio amylolyticus]
MQTSNHIDASDVSIETNEADIATPVWDKDQAMHRVGDSDEFMVLIANSFLGSVDSQVENLTRALENGDMGAARNEFHAFKGVAGNISAIELMNNASELEVLAKEQDRQKISEKLPEFERKLAALIVVLNEYIAEVG